MTSPAASAPQPAEVPLLAADEWTDWLRTRVDVSWREGEWHQETWFFDGDPLSPRTGVLKCVIVDCWVLLPSRQQLCPACQVAFASSGLEREEFITSYCRPDRVRAVRGQEHDLCLIERGGVRCGRPGHSLDLCRGHYSQWKRRRKRPAGITWDAWIVTDEVRPYPPMPPCSAPECDMQSTINSLCSFHDTRWRREKRGGKTSLGATQWAKTAPAAGPHLKANQFTLLGLPDPLRWEIVYGLQQRDARGGIIEPTSVRHVVRALAGRTSLLGLDPSHEASALQQQGNNAVACIRELIRHTRLASLDFRGMDPTDGDQWDLTAIGLGSRTLSGFRQNAGTADFTQIRQVWLREIVKDWARITKPDNTKFMEMFRACLVASDALHTRPGGGQEATSLGWADMEAVFQAFCELRREDGELTSHIRRRQNLSTFLGLLDFGRRADLLNTLPGSFGRRPGLVIPREEANEDAIGRAIPEPVIAQLDTHLTLLGHGFPYGDFSAEHVHAMLRTAYVVLRDTGRRPAEVCSLHGNCLETIDGETNLVWDNHKRRRYNRRLPITTQTAEAIRTWQALRDQVPAPNCSTDYLFPAMTDRGGFKHLRSHSFGMAMREWVDALPELVSDQLDMDGERLPFDRSLIFPYAFRHSYAQRHADAGVPVDVLKELMDHRQLSTTMGYYQVSLKRKREAVQTMRLHVVDRSGRPTPFTSTTAYEARSVAVPYGNCTEPSNVKAGGKSCPLRFQCAGCGFYRPDPSYLPAIEEHLNSLRADRETARAMDADDFVVRNLTDQITAFNEVSDRMRDRLDELPSDERHEIEEASTVLRKVRATQNHRLLPLTVIQKPESRDAG